MGFEIFSVDRDPFAPMFSLSDNYRAIDIFDIDEVVGYAIRAGIDFVTTYNIDQGMWAVSEIQKKLKMPFIPFNIIDVTTKKDLMRMRWHEMGINIPDFYSFENGKIEDAIRLVGQSKKNWIVKPVDNAAKRGISKIVPKDPNSLEKIIEAYDSSAQKRIILEEEIFGDLYFVPTFIFPSGEVNTAIIAQQFNENFVQLQFDSHVNLSPSEQEEIRAEAVKAVKPFGAGAYHTEVIYSKEKGCVLIETSPRVSYATVAISRIANGFDPIERLLSLASGTRYFGFFTKHIKAYVRLVHYVPVANAVFNGDISDISDIEGVDEVTPVVKPGHTFKGMRDNSDRVLYYVISSNESVEHLDALQLRVNNRLNELYSSSGN